MISNDAQSVSKDGSNKEVINNVLYIRTVLFVSEWHYKYATNITFLVFVFLNLHHA